MKKLENKIKPKDETIHMQTKFYTWPKQFIQLKFSKPDENIYTK